MPEQLSSADSASGGSGVSLVSASDLVKLYKHHFDLFLKGYGLQLGVIAAVAGFAFDADASEFQRVALLSFGAVVCVVCAIAWHLGTKWRTHFTVALGVRCGDHKMGSVVTQLAQAILPLSFWSSLIISAACIVCAFVSPPKEERTDPCACCSTPSSGAGKVSGSVPPKTPGE